MVSFSTLILQFDYALLHNSLLTVWSMFYTKLYPGSLSSDLWFFVKIENILHAYGFENFKYKTYLMKTECLSLNPYFSLPVTDPLPQMHALCHVS